MSAEMIRNLLIVLTAFFGLMIGLQATLNKRVWNPYIWGLLLSALALAVAVTR